MQAMDRSWYLQGEQRKGVRRGGEGCGIDALRVIQEMRHVEMERDLSVYVPPLVLGPHSPLANLAPM
jgi:hypothetical protein